jgi:hypothetical protein
LFESLPEVNTSNKETFEILLAAYNDASLDFVVTGDRRNIKY